MLRPCPKCKEKSVVRKCYPNKDNLHILKRVDICINKGCGHKQDLPSIEI
jgi:hypothetical protein